MVVYSLSVNRFSVVAPIESISRESSAGRYSKIFFKHSHTSVLCPSSREVRVYRSDAQAPAIFNCVVVCLDYEYDDIGIARVELLVAPGPPMHWRNYGS
jgi:hypothetical protein